MATSGISPAGLFEQTQESLEVARLLKSRANREETRTFREMAIIYRLLLRLSGSAVDGWHH